jgi:branched-chain amino acid transport system ATP-binding protein
MLLEIEDLIAHYETIEVLKGVSLQVPGGKIVSLIGANGAGKSTLLRTLSGLKRPTAGEIRFDGQRIDGLRPARIVKAGIAQVPEGGKVFTRLTVMENLRTGTTLRRDKEKIATDYEMVFRHFPILRERAKQKAGSLSGGERQMLAFGRALMNGPRLLMLDEPSLGLSPIVVKTIFGIINVINGEGVTILLVEQNAKTALDLADYAYVLETGRVALEGAGRELMMSEEVKKAYLGA